MFWDQSGRTSAPISPHAVQTMRRSSVSRIVSSGGAARAPRRRILSWHHIVSVCSNARDKVERLSQTPRPQAEGVFAAGELAIGGEVVLFECRSLATSSADARARSQRQ
jgi:hypothetical protein